MNWMGRMGGKEVCVQREDGMEEKERKEEIGEGKSIGNRVCLESQACLLTRACWSVGRRKLHLMEISRSFPLLQAPSLRVLNSVTPKLILQRPKALSPLPKGTVIS